jgi:hypothetical protein
VQCVHEDVMSKRERLNNEPKREIWQRQNLKISIFAMAEHPECWLDRLQVLLPELVRSFILENKK